MGIAFAAAVARGLDAHQAGVHCVLDVALEDAVLDQHIALAGAALVIDVERTAAIGQRAVVQHGDSLGRHALADAAAEGAGALAVEVAFQAMAHGFVQQHAGPAGAKHHGHFACRRGARLQVGEGRAHGFVHILRDLLIAEIGQAKTATAAGRAHLTPALLLGDHGDGKTHQRPHVGSQRAIGAGDQHHVVLAGQAGHDLDDTRVLGAGQGFDLAQQLDLGRAVQRGDGVRAGVERA